MVQKYALRRNQLPEKHYRCYQRRIQEQVPGIHTINVLLPALCDPSSGSISITNIYGAHKIIDTSITTSRYTSDSQFCYYYLTLYLRQPVSLLLPHVIPQTASFVITTSRYTSDSQYRYYYLTLYLRQPISLDTPPLLPHVIPQTASLAITTSRYTSHSQFRYNYLML